MKLKINERFVTRIIGENYFQKFNILTKIWNEGKFIIEIEVEDEYAIIREINKGIEKDRIKTYKADAIIKESARDMYGDVYSKTFYVLKGSETNCTYGCSKDIRPKYPTLKDFVDYAKRLDYKEVEVIEFYTPEMVTTIRTVEKLSGKEFDDTISEMIRIGWELVAVSHLITQNGDTKHVATLKKEHEKFDIV